MKLAGKGWDRCDDSESLRLRKGSAMEAEGIPGVEGGMQGMRPAKGGGESERGRFRRVEGEHVGGE